MGSRVASVKLHPAALCGGGEPVSYGQPAPAAQNRGVRLNSRLRNPRHFFACFPEAVHSALKVSFPDRLLRRLGCGGLGFDRFPVSRPWSPASAGFLGQLHIRSSGFVRPDSGLRTSLLFPLPLGKESRIRLPLFEPYRLTKGSRGLMLGRADVPGDLIGSLPMQ